MKFLVGLIIIFILSWGVNIYKFTQLDFEAPYRAEIVRGISIMPLAPLSAITGWITFEEEKS